MSGFKNLSYLDPSDMTVLQELSYLGTADEVKKAGPVWLKV